MTNAMNTKKINERSKFLKSRLQCMHEKTKLRVIYKCYLLTLRYATHLSWMQCVLPTKNSSYHVSHHKIKYCKFRFSDVGTIFLFNFRFIKIL